MLEVSAKGLSTFAKGVSGGCGVCRCLGSLPQIWWGVGLSWAMLTHTLLLAEANFPPFFLFLTECLSFCWLSTYFCLLFKNDFVDISKTALEIVKKIVIWRFFFLSKWFNLSKHHSFHLSYGDNNAVFVSQEILKNRWKIDTNCKALLFTLISFFNEKSLPHPQFGLSLWGHIWINTFIYIYDLNSPN